METDEPVRGRWWLNAAVRVMYVVAGAAVGWVATLMSPSRGSQPWLIWAVLAISLTAACGAVFGYGLARWREIVGSRRLRRGWLVVYSAGPYVAGLGMLLVAVVLSRETEEVDSAVTGRSPAGLLLVAFAGLAALPVVAGLGAIFQRARMLEDDAVGEGAETLLALRRLLAGLLAALGSQVTLATLALGAAPQVSAYQPAAVLVFGAAWSVVIAIAYAPAAGALRAASVRLCRATLPLAGIEPSDLPARADARHQLEQALGVEHNPVTDIQSGILILGPVLASAFSLFIPD